MKIKYQIGKGEFKTLICFREEYKNKLYEDLSKIPEMKSVIGIDPGTNKVGITIGAYEKKVPYLFILLEKNGDNASMRITFEDEVLELVEHILKSMNIVVFNIENQYIAHKYSYARLKSFAIDLEKLAKKYEKMVNKIVPKAWMSTLLKPYANAYNINLNAPTKHNIRTVVLEKFPILLFFKDSDLFDSVGILNHYYEKLYLDDSKSVDVSKGMKIDDNHQLVLLYGKLESHEDVAKEAERRRNFDGNNRNVSELIFNQAISIEDNIRSCTTSSNNIFVGVFKVNMPQVLEIWERREELGVIKEDELMYVIGYRVKYMKNLNV